MAVTTRRRSAEEAGRSGPSVGQWLLIGLGVLLAAVLAFVLLIDSSRGLPAIVMKLAPSAKSPGTAQPGALSSGDLLGTSEGSDEARIQTPPNPEALPPVPDPDLVAVGRNGPLPIIAKDGRRARDVYARPFNTADPQPRIAIVVGGLGLSRTMTDAAIRTLPPSVTLSFTPYARDLQLMVNAAREEGHEVILELPMEPFDYPHNDPGQYTLLTNSDVDENMDKLDWLLSRFTGYAGVVSDQGDKLLAAPEDLRPILAQLNARGLYFLDRGLARRSIAVRLAREIGIPSGAGMSVIDQRASKSSIDLRLLQLEESAREKGFAIGSGYAYPVTIDRIKTWAESLEAKGLRLAPVSAAIAVPQRPESQ